MGLVVEENYNERTMLRDYYPIIRQNIRVIADFINKHKGEIDALNNSITEINDMILPAKTSYIASNRIDIGQLARIAEIIIETEPNGVRESMTFQHTIPGVKYCVFDGDTAFMDTPIEMTKAIVVNKGKFEKGDLKIKFYADDGYELAEYSLEVMIIAGVKIAFIRP